MGSYTVEQVEFLRQRADITYEEALEVLERCNGDLTRCLVDLERRGLIRKGKAHAAPRAAQTESRRSGAYREGSSLGGLLKKLVSMRLVVTKEARIYVDLPVLYLLLAVLCAPHLMIITVVAMFVFGLKIRVETGAGTKVGNDQFYDTVDKVADNIKTTVNNFARAAQDGAEKARRQDVEKHTPYAVQPEADQPERQPEAERQPEVQSEPEVQVDIPEVTPYEEFTGTPEAPSTPDKPDEEENEFTIG